MSESRSLTVELDSETARRLDDAARSAHKQPAKLAEEAIAQYLELCEWQDGKVRQGIDAAERGDFATDEGLKRLLGRFDVDA